MSDLEHHRRMPPGFAAAAAIGALVVLALIVVLAARALGGDDDAPGPTAPPAASTSRCNLADGPQAVPTQAPEADWSLAGRFAVPSNPAFGPGDSEGPVAVCFAKSPTGALFAAVNYLGDSNDPQVGTEALIRARVLMDDRGRALLDEPPAEPSETGGLQLAGFRFVDEMDERISIDMAVRAAEGPSAGQLVSITLTMTWADGDWRVVVPAAGTPPTTAISSLSGYVEWSGA